MGANTSMGSTVAFSQWKSVVPGVVTMLTCEMLKRTQGKVEAIFMLTFFVLCPLPFTNRDLMLKCGECQEVSS